MPEEEAPIDYKWKLIAADLERRISAGELRYGAMLRIRGDLMTHYEAGEATLRHAVSELARRGLVTKLPSSGTYVSWKPGASRGQGAT